MTHNYEMEAKYKLPEKNNKEISSPIITKKEHKTQTRRYIKEN
nr:hypothetical protein [Mycoplasmopsis bovis]